MLRPASSTNAIRVASRPRPGNLIRRGYCPAPVAYAPFTIYLPPDYEFATRRGTSRWMLCTVTGLQDTNGTLYADELEIRLGEGLVLVNERALTLSVREFELLVAMARRTGAVITREELYDSVWGGKLRSGDRSVDVYVSKLRGKLERAMPDHNFIHTHPGFGYRFQPQPSRETAAGSMPTSGKGSPK